MRTLPTVRALALLLSVAGNLVLAWKYQGPAEAVTEVAPKISARKVVAPREPVIDRAPSVAELSAAGLSDSEVKAALTAAITEARLSWERDIRRERSKNAPPWHTALMGSVAFTLEERGRLADMKRRERQQLAEAFGPGAAIEDFGEAEYAYLPEAKAVQAASAKQELVLALSSARSAEDRLSAYQAYETQLSSLLTAGERREVELRESDGARQVGRRFQYFTGDVPTYSRLVDAYNSEDGRVVTQMMQDTTLAQPGDPRLAARDRVEQATRDVLGADRYLEWNRGMRPEFRAVVELEQRYGVSAADAQRLARIPLDTSAAATKIAQDKTMSPQQQSEALAGLAERTRATIKQLLGESVGRAYIDATGKGWIGYLDRGRFYSYTATGISVGAVGRGR